MQPRSMRAAQVQVQASAAAGRPPAGDMPPAGGAADGPARVRPAWWRRLCASSFELAGITAVIVWVAVAELLRQGRLESVLSAGRAQLAAPLLVALIVGAAIGERIWPAERRPLLARGHVQDVCFVALHAVVVIPLMTLLSVGAAALIGRHAIWDVLGRPGEIPSRAGAVGRTGLNGRPVPVEQGGSAGLALLLLAEQLIETFGASRG